MNLSPVRVWAAFLVGLVLSILPLPDFITAFKPPWILLFVLYLENYFPGNLKLPSILLLGLSLDVMLSSVIGEHAFALLFVTWIASSKTRRFRFFSTLQQICLVGAFSLLYESTLICIDALLGFHYQVMTPLFTTATSMILWPWIRILGEPFFIPKIPSRSIL